MTIRGFFPHKQLILKQHGRLAAQRVESLPLIVSEKAEKQYGRQSTGLAPSNLGLIFSAPYALQAPPVMIPGCRARYKPGYEIIPGRAKCTLNPKHNNRKYLVVIHTLHIYNFSSRHSTDQYPKSVTAINLESLREIPCQAKNLQPQTNKPKNKNQSKVTCLASH